MATFEVTIYRHVCDSTRAFVTIEAANEDEALKKAEGLDKSELEFDWWQCCDCTDVPDEYEVQEIKPSK